VTPRSMAGVSVSIIPSPSAPTHPLLESTWANQPTATIEVVEDTEEVVAAATDEMIVATEEEMRAGDITQGGLHLPIIVAVEVDAGGTTDPVPDRIPHVARIPRTTTERGKKDTTQTYYMGFVQTLFY